MDIQASQARTVWVEIEGEEGASGRTIELLEPSDPDAPGRGLVNELCGKIIPE
jgi:hypothetical protein